MKRQTLCLLAAFLVFFSLIQVNSSLAAPYFQGKRITLIVGFAPGGGYDRMARLLARYLPEHIPGKPRFIVKNIPGGSSMIAANRLYNIEKPDGFTIGTINRGLPLAQLLKVDGVEFDLRKFSWLGSTSVDTNVLCVRADLPYQTFEEFKKAGKTLFMAAGGPMTSSSQFGVLLKEFLNLDIKIVTYTNMANALLAVERKEADGVPSTYSSLLPMINRGVLRPLIRSQNSAAGIENLPVDENLAATERGKTFLGMRAATDNFGRPYVAPPGVPGDVLQILRDGLQNVSKDPKFLKAAEKAMMEIQFVSHEKVMKGINYLLNQPDDIVTEFSKYIKF
ncbi:MAG: tripartite tricarboxylate transporter substrate-binding protein [Desulfobacterales bacterium]|nr:tripartite tricarboxylate transporter substrate-binding protein [Desulfobacterales bacterium]